MTVLYLRTADTGWGAGRKQITGSRSATAAVTSVTNTAAITGGIGLTDTPGGTVLAWWFRVGQPVTLGGTFTARIRGFESNLLANAQFSIQLDACTVGTVLGAIMPLTMCTPTELTTTDAANSISTQQQLSGITVNTGDFIRCTIRINAVGTMAAGYTVTMSYDGPTSGAAGDSFLNFSDTLINYPPAEVLQAQLPGPPTAAITGTAKNQGAWAGSKIASVLSSQTTGTQTNQAVTGGQIASVLTSAISGTNNVQGVLVAPIATVLTSALSGTQLNQANTGGTLPRPLTASITGTVINPGTFSARLPRLTSQTSDLVVPKVVQSGIGDAGAVNGTSQVAILGSTLTKGSVILAALTVANQTATSTITDDAGLVWQLLGATFYDQLGIQQALYWARNNTTNSQLSVSVTWSATAAKRSVILVEVVGVDPIDSTVLDLTNGYARGQSTNSAYLSSPNMVPTTPGDFMFSFAASTSTPTPYLDPNAVVLGAPQGGTVTAAYEIVVGAPLSTIAWKAPVSGSHQVMSILMRPAGVHSPRVKEVSTVRLVANGGYVGLPSSASAGDKCVIFLHVSWSAGTMYTADDVTVQGFTNAGWAASQDSALANVTALWVGWRDLQLADFSFQVNVPGSPVSIEYVTEALRFDGGAPVGSPWGPNGLTAGYGVFTPWPSSPPPLAPSSSYALNQVYAWSSGGGSMTGTTPSTLYWVNRTFGSYANYLYESTCHDAGSVYPTFTPNAGSQSIALFGQVENGARAMPGALVAQLPSLTGTLLEVQGIPAVLTARLPLATSALTAAQAVVGTLADQLPLMRTTLTATTANVGVLSAQVASVLTTAQTATQVNAGTLAAQFSLLTSKVADQGTAVIVAQLPLLSGSLTATMADAGVTASPKLPLLTNQTTAANINQAVLTGTLPHPLTTQTTVSQTNTGSTISFLPFPLLTSTIAGSVVGQAGIAARLPLLTGAVVGLAAGSGTVAAALPLLTWQGVVTQTNQGSVSGQIGSAVTTTGLTGTLLNQAVTTAKLPLLTAFLSDAIPGTVAGTVPLLTAAMTGTLVTLSGSVSGNLPPLVGTLVGTPIIGGDLTTAVLPLLTTALTADFFIHGTVHVPLPLLRTHLRGDSLGAVYLDVTVSAAPTRQGGMRVGSGDTHTLTLAGAAGTRADTVAAGDMRVGLTAGATRAERGPR